ncbi:MAG: protein-methionine-sulfoxide reductase heme-binding subunit MsrQ [Gemmatimonadales bacterium]
MTRAHFITRVLKPGLWLAGLGPTFWLLYAGFAGRMGADPIKTLRDVTGLSALVILFVTLSVTPLRRATGWNEVIRVRRLIGLFAFFYATVHAVTYFIFDQEMSYTLVKEDVLEHPWVTVGFTAWVLLIPLAITSTNGWARRLGKRWGRLHRLVYVIPALGVLHYLWLVKRDVRTPEIFGWVLIAILATRLRVWNWGIKGLQDWRSRRAIVARVEEARN